jgi:LysM repeat protein
VRGYVLSVDTAAHQAVQDAIAALRLGDKCSARRAAQHAVFLAGDTEIPWLVLAELSSPHAGYYYVQQALKINPSSPLAIQALRRVQAREQKQAVRASSMAPPAISTVPRIAPAPRPVQRGNILPWILAAEIVALLFVAILVGYTWPRGASIVSKTIPPSSTSVQVLSVASGITSTVTPTEAESSPPASATPTRTPTQKPTITPFPTSTPTSKPTSTPSPTITATNLPTPTKVEHPQNHYTVKRGETLAKIAAKYGCDLDELIRVNGLEGISRVKPGTRLLIPPGDSVSGAQAEDAPPPAPQRGAGKSILVDISEQQMYAYEGKTLVFSYDVSTGRNGSTFTGTFSILDKIPNAWSAPWGFWMPYWMGIYYVGSNLENGFHSLPVLTHGQQIWGDEIGVPITYGCVVLDPGNMKRLYNWAEIGTPVVIRH